MTLEYDIERVLAMGELLRDATRAAIKHPDLPDWMRHRFSHIFCEAEMLECAIRQYYYKELQKGQKKEGGNNDQPTTHRRTDNG